MAEWRLELFMKPEVYHALKEKADVKDKSIGEYLHELIAKDLELETLNPKL